MHDARVQTKTTIVLVTVVTQTESLFITVDTSTPIVSIAERHNIPTFVVAIETQIVPTSITTTVVNDMGDTAFTTASRHTSPLHSAIRLEVVLAKSVTNLDEVDAVINILLETAIGHEPSSKPPPQKGLQQEGSSSQSIPCTKKQKVDVNQCRVHNHVHLSHG